MSIISPLDSQSAPQSVRRVVVVGAGIAGLAAAHRLSELDRRVDIVLLEASDRVGGILKTKTEGDFLIEQGADSFITNLPWGVDLCRRVGIEHELLQTDETRRRTFVVNRGRLQPVPAGFLLMAPSRLWPVLKSPILSWRGKLRLAAELLVPRQSSNDEESLAAFATRRLGRETFERLVQPLIGGIYSADPSKLSLAATMPRFIESERKHRSLIMAARRNANGLADKDSNSSGARYSQFVTPRRGMESLATAVANRLPSGTLRINQHVEQVSKTNAGWRIRVQGDETPILADGLILSASTPVAAKLLANVDAHLADKLSAIPHAGMAIVTLAYREGQIRRPVNGFGIVVPTVERRQIVAVSMSSNKFTHRAPAGYSLIRVFLGGAMQSELVDLPGDELTRIATRELQELLGIAGAPLIAEASAWRNVMPQYHVGHQTLIQAIEAAVQKHAGLALAGNAYSGVGIPQVIRSGELAAEGIYSLIASAP